MITWRPDTCVSSQDACEFEIDAISGNPIRHISKCSRHAAMDVSGVTSEHRAKNATLNYLLDRLSSPPRWAMDQSGKVVVTAPKGGGAAGAADRAVLDQAVTIFPNLVVV